MLIHIVSNLSPRLGFEVPFADRTRVFEKFEDAVAQFEDWGGEDPYHLGYSRQPGSKNFFEAGDTKVELINLEVQKHHDLVYDANVVALKARAYAEDAHRGQKRSDNVTLYFAGHVEPVANAVSLRAKPAAYLHDVIENSKGKITLQDLRNAGFPKHVVRSVSKLTVQNGQNYDLYIQGIASDEDATEVKIADMEHNLSCDPTERNRAKYERLLPGLKRVFEAYKEKRNANP